MSTAVCTLDDPSDGLAPDLAFITDCIPAKCLAVALTFLIKVSIAVSCPMVNNTVDDIANLSDRSL